MKGGLGLMALGLLAGCAATPGPAREGELQRAMRECRDRGGILIPFGRFETGRVETDYACQFNGPPPPGRGRDPRR